MKKSITTIACLGLAAIAAPNCVTAAEPASTLWESSIALGFTLTQGNSDTLLGTVNWLSTKKWDKNELRFGADGAYGKSDGDVNTEYLRGLAHYNRLFTERFYGYVHAEGYHDGVADIDYRFILSPGVGYYFIKEASTSLSGEMGPGWVTEKKGGKEDDFFTLRFAERFEHKFNDRVRVWQSVEYLPQIEDWANYILNGEIGVESGLSKTLSLRVYLQDTYTSRPAAGRKENDLKLVTALAYKF